MPPGAERERVALIDVVNVIGQEQRSGMARHVGQRFTGVFWIFLDFSIGVAVAGNDVKVFTQRTGNIHLNPTRAYFARGFGVGLVANGFGIKHVTFVNIKEGDIRGHAVEQVEFSPHFISRGLFRR